MAAIIELCEAQNMISNGVEFGDVFPLVAEYEQEQLKKWYVTTDELPNLNRRKIMQRQAATGQTCDRCGGLLVRTGSCMTCQDCGNNEGCG